MAAYKITVGNFAVTTTGNTTTVTGTFTTAAGVAIETGSMTVTLYRTDGSTLLTGITQPITLTHTSGGVWTGTVPGTLVWPTSRKGKAVFGASDGTNIRTKSVQVSFGEDAE